jgi:hypothetical protein
MSTRIFKFNLNNNDQCGGGSLKQRGGGNFKEGDRIRVKSSGEVGRVVREASISEFGLDLYIGNTYYVLDMDGGNKKSYKDLINSSNGRGGYNYVGDEKDLESASAGAGGVLGGLVDGITGLLGAVTGSTGSSGSRNDFDIGTKVLVNGEVFLGTAPPFERINAVNKKGVVTAKSKAPVGMVYGVNFNDGSMTLEVSGTQLSKDDNIFLPNTSATSEMPSPSPGKSNQFLSQTSSAFNAQMPTPKRTGPSGVSETSSAFNTQMNIPKRTSVTSSEVGYQVPSFVSRKETNVAALYASIPKRTSANRQNGGFYNESMLGQFGGFSGFNEERMINSYADIPKRRTPTFN